MLHYVSNPRAIAICIGWWIRCASLSFGEAVPLARAKAFYHWAVVVFLGTFDIAIFTKVVQGLIAIW